MKHDTNAPEPFAQVWPPPPETPRPVVTVAVHGPKFLLGGLMAEVFAWAGISLARTADFPGLLLVANLAFASLFLGVPWSVVDVVRGIRYRSVWGQLSGLSGVALGLYNILHPIGLH